MLEAWVIVLLCYRVIEARRRIEEMIFDLLVDIVSFLELSAYYFTKILTNKGISINNSILFSGGICDMHSFGTTIVVATKEMRSVGRRGGREVRVFCS